MLCDSQSVNYDILPKRLAVLSPLGVSVNRALAQSVARVLPKKKLREVRCTSYLYLNVSPGGATRLR